MSGVNSELAGAFMRKLIELFGNRRVPHEWWDLLVRNLGEIEDKYRECPEFKEPGQEEEKEPT